MSEAVHEHGWRLLLGALQTTVPVGSLAQGVALASDAVAVCGGDADRHLHVELRPRLVLLTLRAADRTAVSARDVELACRIAAVVRGAGLRTEPGTGPRAARSVQLLEIAIDALDIPAVRPFWKAVLGYADEPGGGGPEDPLVDPYGLGPAVWFQRMDRPRPQRNRVHLDVSVPHDEAPRRVGAAMAAGGRLVSAVRAPAFWVLADQEGNEACVSTWQGRGG